MFVLTALLVAGCGGTSPAGATRCLVAPETREARSEAIDAFGRRAWAALTEGAPQGVLFDDLELRALLDAAGATRFSARRITLTSRLGGTSELPARTSGAEYAGVCLQGARVEDAGGVLGLQRPGWIFARALVIGRRPGGQRVASWLEGAFVYSDAGFRALDLERVEAPRWEHSDLELAPCDFAVRDDQL
jgi:hypothetical protein